MATNKNPIFPNSVSTSSLQITVGEGTTKETAFSPGADGGVLTQLSATTTDTADVVVVVSMNDGTTANVLGEVTVPANSGTDSVTPSKDLLDSVALPGVLQTDGTLLVGAGASVEVNAKATLSTGILSITASGGSYAA